MKSKKEIEDEFKDHWAYGNIEEREGCQRQRIILETLLEVRELLLSGKEVKK